MRAVASAMLLAACAGEPVSWEDPDPARTGLDGLEGPYGAASVDLRASARASEAVLVEIVYPSDERGEPDVSDAPTVVLVHGGFVAPDRYRWLAVHWATRGYVVAMPRADWLLAITQPGNGEVALRALREASGSDGRLEGLVASDGPVAVSGHSLGGVLAAGQWARDDGVEGLVLLASFPAAGTDLSGASDKPAVALAGETDAKAPPDDVESHLEPIEGPLWYGVVDGMNHYAWTDDPSEGELAGDGEQTRSVGETRRDAQRVLDTWLDAWLRDDPAALGRLDGAFPGVVRP